MKRQKITTSSELKRRFEQMHPDSPFFSRETMKFFGDTMQNFGVRFKAEHNAYELWRRKPVKHGLKKSHYFDANTLKETWIK
jgi:hypothetical protein